MKPLILTAALLLSSIFVYGQQERAEVMEAQRVAFITKQLDLTSEESAKFWPVYNAYQKELDQIKGREGKQGRKGQKGHRMRKGETDTMTEAEAEVQLAKMLAVGQKELDLKSKLIRDLKGVIPATKIVKLKQADRGFKKKLLQNIAKRRGNGKDMPARKGDGEGN